MGVEGTGVERRSLPDNMNCNTHNVMLSYLSIELFLLCNYSITQ